MTPLVVMMLGLAPAVDFETQVVPILTRSGCNSGACHGAAAGRGGLHLSLWGSDPGADHDALVNALEGRRINLIDPPASLLLRKATADLDHGGDRRFTPDSEAARVLAAWIKEGAPRGPGPRLTRLQVEPSELRVRAVNESIRLSIKAHFDDGATADVTRWAVFTTTDPAAVEVDGAGKGRVLRPGQHAVLVRFLDRIVAVRVLLPLSKDTVDLSRALRDSYIDAEIYQTLEALGLRPAARCDDAAFLRRVSLDLTGTLPAPEKVRAFLADGRADRRARLIDELLASDDYADFWTLKWSHWLGLSSKRLGDRGAAAMSQWLRRQIAENTPLDRVARELLTTVGDAERTGPANFVRLAENPGALAENVGRLFMGSRVQCANCHNHPLDRWTQDDYHGLAAVFARLERGRVVKVLERGEVIHPRTGEPAVPRLPGAKALDPAKDQRGALADWLTSADNPHFARALANRVWKEMMGRGLVDPVDDLRSTNPASHPELLDRLADDLAKNRFDLRHLLRRIARSEAYQRGTAGTVKDDRFYSRALVRPLSPEVHADALAAVTGIADRFGTLPPGTRAITLADAAVTAPALEVLGRCAAAGPCDSETRGGGLAQVLHLVNGGLLNDRISSADGRLRKLLDGKADDAAIVREFYLRAYGRAPREAEAAYWAEQCSKAKTPAERRRLLEDFVWALLTSKEFVTNH